jgi:hypothetical protein
MPEFQDTDAGLCREKRQRYGNAPAALVLVLLQQRLEAGVVAEGIVERIHT